MSDNSVARISKDAAGGRMGGGGAASVITNNLPTAIVTSVIISKPNPGDIIVVSPVTVFAENQKVAVIGGTTARGRTVSSGSDNVFAGENGPGVGEIIENDDIDDGTPAGNVRSVKLLETQVRAGTLDKKIVERTKAATPAESSVNTATQLIVGGQQACGQIHSMTTFPMDLKISKTFTVGNMLKTWLDGRIIQFPHHKLRANKGFSIDQIVCNLSLLCQNVLDPLYAQYPDWRITNSFREGENQSQHGNGQACDIVLDVRNKLNTYNRAQWIRDNLPHDQLLLEYEDASGYTKNWIHVSFTGNEIYRTRNGSGPKGCRTLKDSNKVGTLYNSSWKASTLQLY